jgi:hypothetical protein
MKQIRTGSFHSRNFIRQAHEIGCEDRGGN